MAEQSKSAILKARLIHLLGKYPELRDDPHFTLAVIWKNDGKRNNIDNDKMTLTEFLEEVKKGYDSVFSNPESVRRLWQKVQQDNKHLRGEKWANRHGIEQHKRREEFRSFSDEPIQPINHSTDQPPSA